MMAQQSVASLTELLGAKAREIYALKAPRFRPTRPRLTIPQILAWADAHRARTGWWPTIKSGEVAEAPGETWPAISFAVYLGFRGCPGGMTLAQLLAYARGVRNRRELPPLGIRKILKWADAHHARHGTWPESSSGAIPESGGENWARVNAALHYGVRGLKGGSTLARLLAARRCIRDRRKLPNLTIAQIVAWADDHFAANGRWPGKQSGGVRKARGESWRGIDMALIRGHRGLPRGMSLARLLEQEGRR